MKIADKNRLNQNFEENTDIILKPGNFEYKSLHLKTVKTSNDVLFDDAFAIYQTSINSSQKESMKLHKQISWKTLKEIKLLPNRWPEIDHCIFEAKLSPYLNYEFTSNYILGLNSF